MRASAHRSVVAFLSWALVSLTIPAAGYGQEPSTGAVMRTFRDSGNRMVPAYVLASRTPGFTRGDREAVADSLEAVALQFEETPVLARAAVVAFALAAQPGRGTPYQGSLQRLRRIYDASEDSLMKVHTFGALLDVPGTESEFDLAHALVTAPGTVGALALSALALRGKDDAALYRPPVKMLLRRVIEAGGFRNPNARVIAAAIAEEYGWSVGPS